MTERAETADGLRVSFPPRAGVEDELRRLVAVETGCCAWTAWAVESDGEATVLDVRSCGPGISALQGMFRCANGLRPPAGVPHQPGQRGHHQQQGSHLEHAALEGQAVAVRRARRRTARR